LRISIQLVVFYCLFFAPADPGGSVEPVLLPKLQHGVAARRGWHARCVEPSSRAIHRTGKGAGMTFGLRIQRLQRAFRCGRVFVKALQAA
jgi:hypothetical protein